MPHLTFPDALPERMKSGHAADLVLCYFTLSRSTMLECKLVIFNSEPHCTAIFIRSTKRTMHFQSLQPSLCSLSILHRIIGFAVPGKEGGRAKIAAPIFFNLTAKIYDPFGQTGSGKKEFRDGNLQLGVLLGHCQKYFTGLGEK